MRTATREVLAALHPLVVGFGAVVAVALAAGAVAAQGGGANGIAWALVQLLLVGIALYDLATRRIPNVVTLPAAVAAVLLRVLFVHGALVEILVAGACAFVVFLVSAIPTRGIGMGDAKLAGVLGLLLGETVVYALLIGTIVGGLVSLLLVARSRVWLRRSIAYGPYLCLGGAIAILALDPPRLL